MSKSSKRSKRRKSAASDSRRTVAPDRAIYTGFIMIGVFIVLLAIPLTGGGYWRHTALAYLVLMLIFINHAAWLAYSGSRMRPWQAALARLPLRRVGYGSKRGRPIEAAHDKPEVRMAVMLFGIVSLVILAAATAMLIPGILW